MRFTDYPKIAEKIAGDTLYIWLMTAIEVLKSLVLEVFEQEIKQKKLLHINFILKNNEHKKGLIVKNSW